VKFYINHDHRTLRKWTILNDSHLPYLTHRNFEGALFLAVASFVNAQDPGDLIRLEMDSRVGILLDEIPEGSRRYF
jgi:hypothetical protein